jgi:hypothetical protein
VLFVIFKMLMTTGKFDVQQGSKCVGMLLIRGCEMITAGNNKLQTATGM